MKNLPTRYELVVIGGGPAGTPCAMEFAKMNPQKKILLVDIKGELGGECLFDGCIPSKILQITAGKLTELQQLEDFGITLENTNINLDWPRLVQRKQQILARRTTAAKQNLLSFGNIKLVKAAAHFVSENSLSISVDDQPDQTVQFNRAVIATGSRTFIPPFRGNGVDRVWDNKSFFDNMELPTDMTIIGDGPIGIELGQILARLGVRISLIGNQDRILPMLDQEVSDLLLTALQQQPNLNLILQANVESIDYDDGFIIHYSRQGETHRLDSSRVLVSTGRTPNIESLNLNAASIKSERHGIVVDAHLQTTNSRVFAVGDVALGFPQFAHSASYGAHIAAQNLLIGKNLFKVDFDKNSWVLFSQPNIVSAGISPQQAQQRGIPTLTGRYDFAIDAKSQIEGKDNGYLKFLVNKKNLRIIGITIITHDANVIAGEAAVILSMKMTLKDLVNTIQPHPTLSESYTFLAKNMMADIMAQRMKKPLFKMLFGLLNFFSK